MSQDIFCPRCHRKNNAASEECSYCGADLRSSQANMRTTRNVPLAAETPEIVSPCTERKVAIPPGGIGLLFDKDQSIIRESNDSFILGRYGQTVITSSTFIDLVNYGATELGVSRNHARISYENGTFVVEDLESTNGSWLNDTQLTPGQFYPLQNNDRLVLGRLGMCICLGERPLPQAPSITFSLQNEPALDKKGPYALSLPILQKEILPYLEALAFVQEGIDAGVKRPSSPLLLLSIQAAGSKCAMIKASGVIDAVSSVADRVSAWRNLHSDSIGSKPQEVDPIIYQSLVQLVAVILADHNAVLNSQEKFEVVEKLSPQIAFLALNPLTLSTE